MSVGQQYNQCVHLYNMFSYVHVQIEKRRRIKLNCILLIFTRIIAFQMDSRVELYSCNVCCQHND